MYGGYVGKILRVDLSTGRVKQISTWDYVPDFLGGIGLGYRLLWNEINENTSEWSPENPLIFASGPFCGTPVPSSGRAEIVGLAPQGYPKPWAIPSGIGGDIGPKMKWAGYDAIVIVGKAQSLKYLYISEDGAQIEDGENLRGMTSYTTQDRLFVRHGLDVAMACIGPAGENLVRWATIQSKARNASGQGGLGAVMGDKKLKAVVIKPGTCKVPVARPEKLIEEVVKISREIAIAGQNRLPLSKDIGRFIKRQESCAWCACTSERSTLPICHSLVPRTHTGSGSISGVTHCVGSDSQILLSGASISEEVRSELGILVNVLGLNAWEAFAGMGWFFQNCQNAGLLSEIMGEKVELNRKGPAVYPKQDIHVGMPPELAVKWLRGTAYRKDEGDIWAEGTPRAAEIMGLANQAWKTHKFGYGPHHDGRYHHFKHFPVWLVSALTWATQGRDPFNQEHGHVSYYVSFVKEWQGPKKSMWDTNTIAYADICQAGAKLYGVPHANAGWDKPELGYLDKEYVTFWHNHRGIIKSSVMVCDRVFPLLAGYDPDHPTEVGDVDAEVRLFNAVVGTDWTLGDMNLAAERIFNLLRAIHVRQGRGRSHDESVIPYFEQMNMYPDEPGPQVIDTNKFIDLLERYYDLRGWDKTTGCPTKAKLEELKLPFVAQELFRLGKLS
jgi:aldehyde:ferredoxin oxidoreductase